MGLDPAGIEKPFKKRFAKITTAANMPFRLVAFQATASRLRRNKLNGIVDPAGIEPAVSRLPTERHTTRLRALNPS